jgi:hypothetical protein
MMANSTRAEWLRFDNKRKPQVINLGLSLISNGLDAACET